MSMSEADLNAIEDRARRGPDYRYLDWARAGGPSECAHGYAEGIPCPACDIAHSREDVPRLLVEVRELRALAGELAAEVKEWDAYYLEPHRPHALLTKARAAGVLA